MTRYRGLFLLALFLILVEASAWGQGIPLMLPHTGTIAVGGTPFNGNGQFKFAIINGHADCNASPPGAGCVSYWSNDNTSVNGTASTSAVTVSVSGGVFSVKLGDTALTNMQTIQTSVFNNATTYLRVWFDDGATGFQQLSPDRQLVSVPYAYRAEIANSVTGTTTLTAQAVESTFLFVGDSVVEIVGIDFTCPASGFVIAQGYTNSDIRHDTGTRDNMYIKLSKSLETGCCPEGWTQIVIPASFPTDAAFFPAFVTVRFSCSKGVTERYRINAQMIEGSGNDRAGRAVLIVQYSPN